MTEAEAWREVARGVAQSSAPFAVVRWQIERKAPAQLRDQMHKRWSLFAEGKALDWGKMTLRDYRSQKVIAALWLAHEAEEDEQ